MKFKVVLIAILVILLAWKTPFLGSYAAIAGLVSAGVIFLVVRSAFQGSALAGGRMMVGHGHAHGKMSGQALQKFFAKHEGGHAAGAKKVGGRVTGGYLKPNSGLVTARIPDTPKAALTFLYAGRYAVGSGYGASADNAEIRKEIRRIPAKDRSRIVREAKSDARSAARMSEVNRIANKMLKTGRP